MTVVVHWKKSFFFRWHGFTESRTQFICWRWGARLTAPISGSTSVFDIQTTGGLRSCSSPGGTRGFTSAKWRPIRRGWRRSTWLSQVSAPRHSGICFIIFPIFIRGECLPSETPATSILNACWSCLNLSRLRKKPEAYPSKDKSSFFLTTFCGFIWRVDPCSHLRNIFRSFKCFLTGIWISMGMMSEGGKLSFYWQLNAFYDLWRAFNLSRIFFGWVRSLLPNQLNGYLKLDVNKINRLRTWNEW